MLLVVVLLYWRDLAMCAGGCSAFFCVPPNRVRFVCCRFQCAAAITESECVNAVIITWALPLATSSIVGTTYYRDAFEVALTWMEK